MRFTYYGYNAFVVESAGKTIILDPGQNLHWRELNSLIPCEIWPQADLILDRRPVIEGGEWSI